jgi:hypothetical protein
MNRRDADARTLRRLRERLNIESIARVKPDALTSGEFDVLTACIDMFEGAARAGDETTTDEGRRILRALADSVRDEEREDLAIDAQKLLGPRHIEHSPSFREAVDGAVQFASSAPAGAGGWELAAARLVAWVCVNQDGQHATPHEWHRALIELAKRWNEANR